MSKKLARSIADAARKMRQKYPDLEGYESVGTEGGLIQCRKPHWPDGVTISVPPTHGSNLAAVGANVVLGFYKAVRQMPFIKSIRGMARGGTIEVPAYAGLMFWLLPEAAPNISCRSAISQPQLKLSTASSVTELVALDRTADASGFAFSQDRTDVLGLLYYETGSHILLTVAHAKWADADSMTGATVEVIEYALGGTANTPVTVTVDTQRWTATNGIYPSRNHGYFFADVTSDDVILTLALESEIVAFKRSVSGVKVSSSWVTDDRRFNGRAGSVACVQQYLLECGYSGLKLDESSAVTAGGARLQLYTRNSDLEYVNQTPIELADLIDGIDTGTINYRKIFPVGLLQPLAEYPSAEDNQDGGWAHNLLSNRWPMLVYNGRREWWIYLNAITSETSIDPKWLTVTIDATNATAATVDTFEADFTWRLLYEGLVETAGASLESAATDSRYYAIDDWPPASGLPNYTADSFPNGVTPVGPTEIVEQAYEVREGQTETWSYQIQGYIVGTYYTGFSAQAAGVDLLSGTISEERFYALPLPGISLPVGDDYTSSQTPSGVFGEDSLHYSFCLEPQHWAADVVPAYNIPVDDWEYASSLSFFKFGDVLNSDNPNPGNEIHLWWVDKMYDPGVLGGLPPIDDPDPRFVPYGSGPTSGTGDGVTDSEVGNVYLGTVDQILTRFYAPKTHGEYSYQMRHRTQLTICNPDKSLRYRQDLSKYYVDGGSDGYTSRYKSPQTLNVWQWLPVRANSVDYLWVLRQDYLSLGALLDDGDNCVDCEQEPALELWQIGAESATLLHRLELHPTTDTGAEWTDGTLLHPPYMLHGVQSDGKPYATIWTEWVGPLGEHGHLITEVLFTPGDPSTLTRSEKWGTGAKPANQPISVEARNAVHHSGTLYWIEGGESLVYKDSA